MAIVYVQEHDINHLHKMEENCQLYSYILVHLISIFQLYLQTLTKYILYCDKFLLQNLKILILPKKEKNIY